MIIKIIFILYAILITGASLIPSELSPDINLWDKGSHFMAYLVFALLASGVARKRKISLYLSFGIVIYSGLLEIAQSAIPGRIMSGRDLLANTFGVAAGFLLSQLLINSIFKKPSTKTGSS